MGFADELRNAPDKKRQEEKLQMEQNWKELEKLIITYIKDGCRYSAENGNSSYNAYLIEFVNYMEGEYTSKEYDGSKLCNIEFDDSTCGLLWRQMRNNFFHYVCKEKQYGWCSPDMFGMSKVDANKLATTIKSKLISEGLQVEIELRKECVKVHYENKFVKHTSKMEKLLTGADGHYEETEVVDEQMYSFILRISW